VSSASFGEAGPSGRSGAGGTSGAVGADGSRLRAGSSSSPVCRTAPIVVRQKDHSDLASRRAAMQSFAYAGTPFDTDDVLLAELDNGHAAATRFDSDLAAARSLAGSTPSVTVAPPDSREAAEVLLLVQYVDKSNAGCDSRGGAVVAELPVITWESDNGGTVGTPPADIACSATLGPDGYQVEIMAC
jgi:hypothetical protein